MTPYVPYVIKFGKHGLMIPFGLQSHGRCLTRLLEPKIMLGAGTGDSTIAQPMAGHHSVSLLCCCIVNRACWDGKWSRCEKANSSVTSARSTQGALFKLWDQYVAGTRTTSKLLKWSSGRDHFTYWGTWSSLIMFSDLFHDYISYCIWNKY